MDIIRKGHTVCQDEDKAVSEISKQLQSESAEAAVIFVSSKYDLKKIEQALSKYFKCRVYGSTTAGEIGKLGYSEHGISGFSFFNKGSRVEAALFENIVLVEPQSIMAQTEKLKTALLKSDKKAKNGQSFGLLLVDGLSNAEEKMTTTIASAFPDLPIVGGSAGDDIGFKATHVLYEGKFVNNAALLLVCSTALNVFTFKTQHFVPSEKKLVITEADEATRTVFKINGLPAALEYARIIGVEVKDFTSNTFSKYPLMKTANGEHFVRSIKEVGPKDSLVFQAAIEQDIVMRLGKTVDFVNNLQDTMDNIKDCLIEPELVLCFECILRRLEVIDKNLGQAVGQIYSDNDAVGFHTYGEQYDSTHINQTLTGIALGRHSS